MPRLLIDEPDFRLVEDVVDGNELHTLEVRDGADALGVERWRTFQTKGSANLQAIFSYLIRIAQKQPLAVCPVCRHEQGADENGAAG